MQQPKRNEYPAQRTFFSWAKNGEKRKNKQRRNFHKKPRPMVIDEFTPTFYGMPAVGHANFKKHQNQKSNNGYGYP